MKNLFKLQSENQPTPPPKQPSRTEPIVGWRGWLVKDGKLTSLIKSTVWPVRKPLFSYNYNSGVGIYTWRHQGQCIESPYQQDCYGAVYLWGKIQEHTDGFLAEYAYPKALFFPRDTDPCKLMEIEDAYGVPCEMVEDYEKQTNQPLTASLLSSGAMTIFLQQTPPQQLIAQQQQQYEQLRAMFMLGYATQPTNRSLNSLGGLGGLLP